MRAVWIANLDDPSILSIRFGLSRDTGGSQAVPRWQAVAKIPEAYVALRAKIS